MQAFDDYVRGRALRPVLGPERVESIERGVLAVGPGYCDDAAPTGGRRAQYRPADRAPSRPAGAGRTGRVRGPRDPAAGRGCRRPHAVAVGRPRRHRSPPVGVRGAPRAGTAAGPEPTEPEPPAWEEALASALAFLRRRLEGDYAVDDFGFDADLTDSLLLPALRPLYRTWFRVETIGMHHVPAEGGALVVANHSGTLPLDSLMTAVALHDEHPAQRHLRMLGADLMFRLPGIGSLARKHGSTLACTPDAERLMSAGELVGVWPEGFKGIGKPFRDRYKLQRFGRGGFVSAALRTGVPIIPCSIVGAEEIYPKIGDIKPLARLFGAPYFPVTPMFPLLRPARARPAAVEVVHRVRRADPHRHHRRGRGRRPDDGVQPDRPGARDDPAHPVPAAQPAPERVPRLSPAGRQSPDAAGEPA